MKKTIQQLTTVLFVGLMLSSCLGDNNSKFVLNNKPVYIKAPISMMSADKIAMNDVVPFTGDYVNKLDIGNFYYLNANVNTKDGVNADKVYIANDVTPGKGDGKAVTRGGYAGRIGVEPQGLEIYPTSMKVEMFSPLSKGGLDDFWMFTYSAMVYKEDTYQDADGNDYVRLVAAIVDEDQVVKSASGEEDGVLPPNKVIVRLYLERRSGVGTPADTKKQLYSGEANINLRELRTMYFNQFTSEEKGKPLSIMFRYYPEPNKDGTAKPAANLGNLDEKNPNFYMLNEDEM